TLGGLPELALRVLDRVLDQDPANASASWYRIIALYESGRDRECVEAGEDYARRFREGAAVYFGMGVSSTALGKLHDAQVYLERAVELGQPPLGPPKYLAVLYKNTSQRDRMVPLLDSTISRYGMMLDAAPDNLHLRCEYAALL